MLYDLRELSVQNLTSERTTPNNGFVLISGSAAINNSLTGAGTLGTNLFNLWSAGSNGGRLAAVYCGLIGSGNLTTQSNIRFYLSDLNLSFKAVVFNQILPVNWPVGSYSVLGLGWSGILKPDRVILVSSFFADTATGQFHLTAFGENF